MSTSTAHTSTARELTLLQQMLASGTGASITALLTTPMDVVKTRLQSQIKSSTRQSSSLFTGSLDAVAKITKNEGILTLWSGLSPTLLSNVPSTVIYFTLYENFKYFIQTQWYDGIFTPFIAGANARIFAASIVSPMELIRTKMQSQKHSISEIKLVLQTSISQDGYKVLWRGVVPTLWRDILFSALYWAGYEQTKKMFLNHFQMEKTSFLQSFTCGATSGSIAAIVTTPFDVVKTQRQITIGRVNPTDAKNISTWNIMKDIVHRNGYRGLLAGVTPRVARIAPSCAIMIGTYEYMKRTLLEYQEK